jgi:hypothetical protein
MTDAWPWLPSLDEWSSTAETVHLWSQVVGKVRLGLGPGINHWWGAALQVGTHGLTTGPMPAGARSVSIDMDFVRHRLHVETSAGETRGFDLVPMSVADFYGRPMGALAELDVGVRIMARPVELPEVIPFAEDHVHASYDAAAMGAYWGAVVQAHRVLTEFRAGFLGKASPVHYFWGSFDLASSRFSGRRAPRHPGGAPNCPDWVMHEAYSHEVWSAGLWPGAGLGEAAFYAYAYPAPAGFSAAPVAPAGAYFHEGLGEFILPYEPVRTAADPDAALRAFLDSTYAAAATLGAWDREALER